MAVVGLSGARGERGSWRQRWRDTISSLWLRGVDQIGPNAVLVGRPHIGNEGRISVGKSFKLGSQPVQSHLVAKPGGAIEIGDRVSIAYGAAISAQLEVRIGDDTRIGPFVVVMDSDYHVAGDRNALAQPAPIRIGNGVTLGARVTILRGSDIGDGARAESGSVISGHVPAGAIVAGVPARPISEKGGGAEVNVLEVVMSALGLSERPNPEHGPSDIPQWDSLGALKLLLALEDAFAISIDEEQLKSATSVAALQRIVETAH
jgi:acetyltransferase-like isoleucine patch superfamily enzyme/acyl carrier protein